MTVEGRGRGLFLARSIDQYETWEKLEHAYFPKSNKTTNKGLFGLIIFLEKGKFRWRFSPSSLYEERRHLEES